MMKQLLTHLTVIASVAGALGCSFAARDAEMYRNDTRALLETKRGEIQQCYNQALTTDATASGTVVVKFTVQSETGKIVDAKVDPQNSGAPPALGACVTQAITALQLKPPDENDGHATFVYEFVVGPPPPPQPAAPPAAAPPG